jgi:ABC-type polysaccharide/polyol phosphate transport system ATPase subunit
VTDPAIDFRKVSHHFRIPSGGKIASFKEWMVRRIMAKGHHYDRISSLDDVSFTVGRGKALGVMGHNGAGKSTLLRIAAGILQPRHGISIVRGRIAPVIDLGFGLENELTGRENIIFNGALLGRSREEMAAKMEEIVDFAELGDFIDNPVRTYSTGMIVRLAFSVATTVEAQILLLDEVLSVGDERFQRKCGERMAEFRERGVTILFVSHGLDAVETICDEGLWLEHGRVVAHGPVSEVVEKYREAAQKEAAVGGVITPAHAE